MKPIRKVDLRKVPKSEDDVWAGWVFRMILLTLKYNVHKISWKTHLKDSRTKKGLEGTVDMAGNIELDLRNRNNPEAVSILIHEIAHRAMRFMPEEMILLFEAIAWETLTDAQKNYLRRFLPRKIPKKTKKPRK
ncbi:MAG: hypothetical protein AAB432_00835 [Patescibacteria group bacterium]